MDHPASGCLSVILGKMRKEPFQSGTVQAPRRGPQLARSGPVQPHRRFVFAAVGGGHGLVGLQSLVSTCETAVGPPLICLRTMKYLHSKDRAWPPDNIGATTARFPYVT